MSAISFEVQIEQEEARARLQAMLDRMDNRKPFFDQVGQSLADSTRARFRAERDPDGNPWVPLKPATIRARTRRGRACAQRRAQRLCLHRGHERGGAYRHRARGGCGA